MSIISCTFVSPLRIVTICFMIIAFVLHAVGFSAKKWDVIYINLYGHQYDAYQNLWNTFDADITSGSYAVYSRVDTSIPEWKMHIIYLETTGLGLAVMASLLLLLSSFVTRVAKRRKIQVTMIALSVIGCFIAAGESIAGVKLYLDEYLKIIGINGNSLIEYEKNNNQRTVYGLTWAPYMCMGAGAVYALVGVFLIIDMIYAIAKGTSTTPVTPIDK